MITEEIELFVINDMISDKQKISAYNLIKQKAPKLLLFGIVLNKDQVDTVIRKEASPVFSHVVESCRSQLINNDWKYYVKIRTLDTSSGRELENRITSGEKFSTDCDFAVFSGGNEEVVASVLSVHLRQI
jgi:hypothetical protein